jgi:hypothetical protein
MRGPTVTKVFNDSGFRGWGVAAQGCTLVPQMHTAHGCNRARRDNELEFLPDFRQCSVSQQCREIEHGWNTPATSDARGLAERI